MSSLPGQVNIHSLKQTAYSGADHYKWRQRMKTGSGRLQMGQLFMLILCASNRNEVFVLLTDPSAIIWFYMKRPFTSQTSLQASPEAYSNWAKASRTSMSWIIISTKGKQNSSWALCFSCIWRRKKNDGTNLIRIHFLPMHINNFPTEPHTSGKSFSVSLVSR